MFAKERKRQKLLTNGRLGGQDKTVGSSEERNYKDVVEAATGRDKNTLLMSVTDRDLLIELPQQPRSTLIVYNIMDICTYSIWTN
jgi:hypothetical protein